MYVEVQMLPGSPRVTYRKNRIVYDFGYRKVVVTFPVVGSPKVIYCNNGDLLDEVAGASDSRPGPVRSWVNRTGIPHAVHHVASGTAGAIQNSADRIHDVGSAVTAPVVRVWEATPLSRLTTADPAESAQRLREVIPPGNRLSSFDTFEGTIPTIR